MLRTCFRHAVGPVLLCLAVAGCSDGGGADADGGDAPATAAPAPSTVEAETPAPPTPSVPDAAATALEERALIATATVDVVAVRDAPDAAAPTIHELAHPTDRGAPRVFLVEDRRDGWLQVLLPVRPNGSTGWVREADVDLSQTGFAVTVDLAEFELLVTRDGVEVTRSPIGYGTADTPTPGGRYFITELLEPPDPGGPYGSFAFGLSGFSDVLLDFAGGDGVIGIHGTNDPDSIGQRVSAGCIRLPDDVITELAAMLPLGTPVEITG